MNKRALLGIAVLAVGAIGGGYWSLHRTPDISAREPTRTAAEPPRSNAPMPAPAPTITAEPDATPAQPPVPPTKPSPTAEADRSATGITIQRGTSAVAHAGRIDGTVTEADGAAVVEAVVTATDYFRNENEMVYTAKTDDRGAFALPELPSNKPLKLSVVRSVSGILATTTADRRELMLTRDESYRLDWVLPSRYTLRGRVVDHDGAPIDRATVTLSARAP